MLALLYLVAHSDGEDSILLPLPGLIRNVLLPRRAAPHPAGGGGDTIGLAATFTTLGSGPGCEEQNTKSDNFSQTA